MYDCEIIVFKWGTWDLLTKQITVVKPLIPEPAISVTFTGVVKDGEIVVFYWGHRTVLAYY